MVKYELILTCDISKVLVILSNSWKLKRKH